MRHNLDGSSYDNIEKMKCVSTRCKMCIFHEELEEDVYIDQPLGYEKKGEEYKVFKLKKALYSLRQAPRA